MAQQYSITKGVTVVKEGKYRLATWMDDKLTKESARLLMCASRSDIVRVRKRARKAAPAVQHGAEFARQVYIAVEARWYPSQLKRCTSLGLLETCNLSCLAEKIQ